MANVGSYVPFLNATSFVREEFEAPAQPVVNRGAWSPFVSVYESSADEASHDAPMRQAYASVVDELYDEEFDESLFELMTDARSLHRDHVSAGHSSAEADRIVTQHFAELVRESEAMVDNLAQEYGAKSDEAVEREIDTFTESYAPSTALAPAFEEFLGKLVKKIGRGVRKVAGAALSGLKKLGLAPILNRIKALVRPLLNRVIQKAIGRLPAAVQPAAQKLAQHLGFSAKSGAAAARPAATGASAEPAAAAASAAALGAAADTTAPASAAAASAAPQDAGSPVQASAGEDATEMQLEFDAQVAEALLAEDEAHLELEIARERSASVLAPPVFSNLEQARERFVQELQNLKEGESPTPHVENFLPAVLPALRIAINLIGRPRVIGFIAGILGKLISKLVGPEQTPALSRAIVDAGLKLISLETREDEARLATSAVAATVEEAVTRIASLPAHVFEDNELLEGFALEAFERAAAANLPAVFSEETYRARPELLEGGVNAAWLMLPLRRPIYKRCSQTFKVALTPHLAESITSFEDTLLSEHLYEQLGLPEGETLETEVHLFEVLPGGTLADIARAESESASEEVTLSQLHPLTDEAAAALLGKPGLGRNLPAWSNARNVAAGQRVYHLALRRRPLGVLGARKRVRERRLVRLEVALDGSNDQIRVGVFISEVKAQRLAVRLRQQSHVGSLAVGFNRILTQRLPPILLGQRRRRLRIVHGSVAPGPAAGPFLEKLPSSVSPVFIAKVQEWLVQAFAEFAKTQAPQFLAASEDPADGVTLLFTIERPAGLSELLKAIADKGGGASAIAESVSKAARPTVRVQVVSGHRRV